MRTSIRDIKIIRKLRVDEKNSSHFQDLQFFNTTVEINKI